MESLEEIGKGNCDCGLVSTTLVAEILTTEGINFSAKSAKLAGTALAKIEEGRTRKKERKITI